MNTYQFHKVGAVIYITFQTTVTTILSNHSISYTTLTFQDGKGVIEFTVDATVSNEILHEIAAATTQDLIEIGASGAVFSTNVEGTTAALNLNTGTATSTKTGADVVTITSAPTLKKLIHCLRVVVVNAASDATLTFRIYTKINGTEREFFSGSYILTNYADIISIIEGETAISDDMRLECSSNRSADDGITLEYQYITESLP